MKNEGGLDWMLGDSLTERIAKHLHKLPRKVVE